MSLIMQAIEETTMLPIELRKKEIVKKMVESGQQVPLTKLLSHRDIHSMEIKHHVLMRYKQRFAKLYDIEIENMIKNDLINHAMIVESGHSGRFKVHTKGMIIVMDENAMYTTYDASGNDKNNIIDNTQAKLKKIHRKSKQQNRLDYLFSTINQKDPIIN